MRQQNKKFGFTLLELSIVILLIALAFFAVSQGRIVLIQSKVNFSQDFTTKSPVALTPNLVAWYEPVLRTSFNENHKYDGDSLGADGAIGWMDSSPSGDNNALIGDVAPTYSKYSINNLPSINFNGATSFLTFNHSDLIQRYFTIFIVEQRASAGVNHLLSFNDDTNLGYVDGENIGGMGISVAEPVPIFNGLDPRILTFLSAREISHTKGVFINGGSGSVAPDLPSANQPADGLVTNQIAGFIGKGSIADTESFYQGNIAEIIIFNRDLNLIERNRIQKYLGKKYNIRMEDSI
ncbi:MAG: prepilin-type N-terminal cleavage/methylation domain-containing protein [Rickettsiales bacterium]|jgi:prepilin-type N-terminal cleavage/methylation domain-containing protein